MNSAGIMDFRVNKKAEHSRITLHPGPDQEPANTNANRSIRQDCAEKKDTISLDTIHLRCWQKTFFTWSVSDVFAVKCEQFSISRCRY